MIGDPRPLDTPDGLGEAIRIAINSRSRENYSNTPDRILRDFMLQTLRALEDAIRVRDRWYDMNPTPGATLAATSPKYPALTFTLREAQALVAAFGGDDTCEMTVRSLPAGAVKPGEGCPHEWRAGLYAHLPDYPEEGCTYLGPGRS